MYKLLADTAYEIVCRDQSLILDYLIKDSRDEGFMLPRSTGLASPDREIYSFAGHFPSDSATVLMCTME